MIQSPYLTMTEAAAYLRMENLRRADNNIGRWLREGRLRGYKRRGKWLFRREDLDSFLERSDA